MPLDKALRINASIERLGYEAAWRLLFRVRRKESVDDAAEAVREIQSRLDEADREARRQLG
jgi:hypothetical protein